jgi:hypothetical protein
MFFFRETNRFLSDSEFLHAALATVVPPHWRHKYALVFLPGLVTGRLFDIGYFKIPYFFASCLLIVCTFLVAECKVYWQFFLVQGLGIGVSFSPLSRMRMIAHSRCDVTLSCRLASKRYIIRTSTRDCITLVFETKRSSVGYQRNWVLGWRDSVPDRSAKSDTASRVCVAFSFFLGMALIVGLLDSSGQCEFLDLY